MEEFVRFWPTEAVGSPSLVLLVIIVIVTLIKNWPIMQKNALEAKALLRGEKTGRIDKLENALEECRRECDERDARYKEEIDALKTKINNEAWQRVQSEISLVSTLIQVVPDPQLRTILAALQKRSSILPADVTSVGGPIEDGGK